MPHQKRKPNHRCGFTLVELLVVIAIIGILVGMLLPAVQMVRESARRTGCSNNVKNLGIAFHNFHSAFNQFPSGVVDNDDNLRDAIRNGWVDILPYIEQNNLFDRYDLNSDWKSGGNEALALENIPVLQCPSNGNDFNQFGGVPGTISDYAMSKGPSGSLVRVVQPEGVFDINSKTSFASVSDGTSNVYLVGEAVSNNTIECRAL